MSIEGRLTIRLVTRKRDVESVHITSSRPVYAAQLFNGKGVDETVRTLPLLFNICATAQSCASVRALEQAMGLPLQEPLEQLRDLLVRLETFREHLWRILLDWPQLLGESPAQALLASVMTLQREYRHRLTGGSDPFRPGEDSVAIDPGVLKDLQLTLEPMLSEHLFGISPKAWLGIESERQLIEWSRSQPTHATRLMALLIERGWAASGRCETKHLAPLSDRVLERLMQDEAFVAAPRLDSGCCETTSLTRNQSPLLSRLASVYGNGLLPRFTARLTELARLAVNLNPALGDRQVREMRNPGIGQATAARGLLYHRVRLDGERVEQYQILAPTEWNFHPQGVVASALGTLKGGVPEIEQQANLLINAIDPCVAYDMRIE